MRETPFLYQDLHTVLRSAGLAGLGFLALVVLLRVSGKRTLSKLNVFDFVFVVAMGSVLAGMITSHDSTLVEGVASLATMIGLQMLLSWLSARSGLANRVINGEPDLLFSNGRFLREKMRHHRITDAEVRSAIRQHGVPRTEDVDAVVLETDGTLTVVYTGKREGASSLTDVSD